MTPRLSTNPDSNRQSAAAGGSLRARRGFSLIEVVVAVGIFAFVIVGVIGLLGPVSKSTSEVVDATVASRLADTVAAELARLRDAQRPGSDDDKTKLDLLYDNYIKKGPELVAVVDGSYVASESELELDGKMIVPADNDPVTGNPRGIAKRDRYFLIRVQAQNTPQLAYVANSGFLAVTITVIWPYKIPDGTDKGWQEVAETNRSVALYNIALTP